MRNMATRPSDFILSSEAARILGISAQSVRAWENAGRLRAAKTARGVRVFSRVEVEQLRDSLDQPRDHTGSAALR
jgi:DNA-binding transcriptional MerR regulator